MSNKSSFKAILLVGGLVGLVVSLVGFCAAVLAITLFTL